MTSAGTMNWLELEEPFLDARRKDKAERQWWGHGVKQALIKLHTALRNQGLEIRQMKRRNVASKWQRRPRPRGSRTSGGRQRPRPRLVSVSVCRLSIAPWERSDGPSTERKQIAQPSQLSRWSHTVTIVSGRVFPLLPIPDGSFRSQRTAPSGDSSRRARADRRRSRSSTTTPRCLPRTSAQNVEFDGFCSSRRDVHEAQQGYRGQRLAK